MTTATIRVDQLSKSYRIGTRPPYGRLTETVWGALRRPFSSARSKRDDSREFWALQDVSLEIFEGEVVGIVGRNGAGKSTLLKILSRITEPTRGRVEILGRVGSLLEVGTGFHPELTGRENIFLNGAVLGMARSDIKRRFDEIVEFAGVERFIDTPVKRYSSGMNARLGFSIAAHLNPRVLIIDEVLAVGDLAFQEKCQARMKSFLAEGVAIVFVSHHLPAVAQLCNQVLLLDSGRSVRVGRPADVIADYCSGNTASEHDDVTLTASLGVAGGGASETFQVKPGDSVVLDLELNFRTDVERATIGVVIWDLTRELYAYGASSDFVGIPPISARAGDTRSFTFHFDANLTRGLYAVEVNVVDPDRHKFLAVARGIQHFHVVEQVSYDGVANLYLRGFEGIDGGIRAAC